MTAGALARAAGPSPTHQQRWLVLTASVIAQAAYTGILIGASVLAPAIRSQFGLSLSALGVVLASASLGASITMLAWGSLADRWGERRVISYGLMGSAAALAGTALAPTAAWLAVTLVLGGLLGAGVIPAGGRAVMGAFEAHERGVALGIRQTGVPIGGILSSLLLPLALRTGGLEAAFFSLSAVCVASAVISLLWLREDDEHQDLRSEPSPPQHPFRDRHLWRLSLGGMLIFPAQSAIVGFTVLFLHQEHGLSTGRAAAVLAGIQFLGAVLRVTTGRWSDRLQTRIVPLRRVTLAMSVALLALAILTNAPTTLVIVVLLVAGGLSLGWNALAFAAVAEAAGRQRSGAALGLQQTGLAISGAVSPIVLAAVIGASSWHIGFLLAAACPFAARAFLHERAAGPSVGGH